MQLHTPSDLINKVPAEPIHYYSLSFFPQNHRIALNKEYGTLSYLCPHEERFPQLVRQEQLTNNEMSAVFPLLECYPDYCPYEVLYAHFYQTVVTEEVIGKARAHLYKAAERGCWVDEMLSIRGALSRARLKLRPFGIGISSILATGYMLSKTSDD